MGIRRWIKETARKIRNRFTKEGYFLGDNGGTAAGINVTPTRAMQATAVYGCVRVLSTTIASLPCFLYERNKASAKDRRERRQATEHPLYSILHDQPNAEMDSYLWSMIMQIHQELRGVSYNWIERGAGGQIIGLWPLHPDNVRPRRVAGLGIVYDITDAKSGYLTTLLDWEVLRILGMTYDGLEPISPIKACKEAIGTSLAGADFTGRFFANDARPRGIIKVAGQIGKTAEEGKEIKRQMQADWLQAQGGANRHKVAIMDQGAEYQAISISPEDAQILETMRFQIGEIAGRIYGVPLFMLGETDKVTSWGSGIEQQMIGFVVYSLRNRLALNERAIRRALLLPQERARYFVEYNVDGLLRGDVKTRYEAYQIGRQGGWLTGNDICRKENLDPMPPEVGDVYWRPSNMMPADAKLNLDTGKATKAGAAVAAILAGRWGEAKQILGSSEHEEQN